MPSASKRRPSWGSIPPPRSRHCAGRNVDATPELADKESPGPRVRRLATPALDDSSDDRQEQLLCLDPCRLGFPCFHSEAAADDPRGSEADGYKFWFTLYKYCPGCKRRISCMASPGRWFRKLLQLFGQEMERLCLRGCSRAGDLQDLMIKKTVSQTRLEPWGGRWFSTGRQDERVRP